MSEPAVIVRGVSKRFRLRHTREFVAAGVLRSLLGRRHETEEFWALRDISFTVERGESVGLMGPNGSGKTTLFSIIAGVTAPTEGSVETRGRISALLQLGAGFQMDLTGRENVYINARLLGLSRKQIRERYAQIMAFAELERFADVPLRNYSSGMRARLGFAVAVHVDPDILIIDEVLSVGDAPFRAKCEERIRQFLERGVTVLFVSHSATQVRRICQRVLLLHEGRLVADTDTERGVALYRSGLVAGAEAGRDALHAGVATSSGPAGRPGARAISGSGAGAASRLPAAVVDLPPEPPVRPGTYFLGNPTLFAFLCDDVFPAAAREGIVRVRYWNAAEGCECYGLVMVYLEGGRRPYELWVEGRIERQAHLERAVAGRYPPVKVTGGGFGGLSEQMVARWFEWDEGRGRYAVRPEVRRHVALAPGDLRDPDLWRALPRVEVAIAEVYRSDLRRAEPPVLERLAEQVGEGGVVVVAGLERTPVERLVETLGLEPLMDRMDEIHRGWRLRLAYDDQPWSLPPMGATAAPPVRWCHVFRVKRALGAG